MSDKRTEETAPISCEHEEILDVRLRIQFCPGCEQWHIKEDVSFHPSTRRVGSKEDADSGTGLDSYRETLDERLFDPRRFLGKLGPPLPDAWRVFIESMERNFGRRDPECRCCGQTVYMALQGFYSGGTWTTDPEAEGPASVAGPTTTRCSESPDGRHHVMRRLPGQQ